MEIYRSLSTAEKVREKTAAALGAFDGLHLGHAKVIGKVLGGEFSPSVFTFSDDPSQELSGKAEYLMTGQDKEHTLEELGIEKLFTVPFHEVKDLEPEDFFFEVLIGKLNVGLISCGYDFRFGRYARGNTDLLEKLCAEAGIKLEITPDVELDGVRISSTAIRELIKDGNILEAERMLGRALFFTIEVTRGNQLGRKMGTPTINQILPAGFVLPKFGVYASVVTVNGKRYPGVCNIGVKPSIKGEYRPSAETWIGGGFNADIYGENIRTELYDFIRPEKKFDSLDELWTEIRKNAAEATEICSDKL